ncbi:MAG: hypothetical protein M1372_02095 [Patescibacteria group bacterium]|nr:hypothetical protein [Patescibacteria group bacterium]
MEIRDGQEAISSSPPTEQIKHNRLRRERKLPSFEEVLERKAEKESLKSEDKSQAKDLFDKAKSDLGSKAVAAINELRRLGIENDLLLTPEFSLLAHGVKAGILGKRPRFDYPRIEDISYVPDPQNPLNKIEIDENGKTRITTLNPSLDTAQAKQKLEDFLNSASKLKSLGVLSGNPKLQKWVEEQAISRAVLESREQVVSDLIDISGAKLVGQENHQDETLDVWETPLGTKFLVKKLTGAKQVSNMIEIWQDEEGRRFVVKKSPPEAKHTLQSEIVQNRIMKLMGLPVPDINLQDIVETSKEGTTTTSSVLVVGFLEGYYEEANPFELSQKYLINQYLQEGLIIDLLLSQYNRRPHNVMMKDGKIAFIDHGAALFSRATGGLKGFSGEVTPENMWDLLRTVPDDNPNADVPVNEAYANVLTIEGGPNGFIRIADPDLLKKSLARLGTLQDQEIRSAVEEAGYPQREDEVIILEGFERKIQSSKDKLSQTIFSYRDPSQSDIEKGYIVDGVLSARFFRDLRWTQDAETTLKHMRNEGIKSYIARTLCQRRDNLIKLLTGLVDLEIKRKQQVTSAA